MSSSCFFAFGAPVPNVLKVTRYTRASRGGKNCFCPECGFANPVFHFAWSALMCLGCRKLFLKREWLLDPLEPVTLLSTSGGKWRVIHQNMPGCADKATRAEAEAYATWAGLRITHLWDGDTATLSLI